MGTACIACMWLCSSGRDGSSTSKWPGSATFVSTPIHVLKGTASAPFAICQAASSPMVPESNLTPTSAPGVAMRTEDMILVSVDDHTVEPPTMWDNHVPDKYKEHA